LDMRPITNLLLRTFLRKSQSALERVCDELARAVPATEPTRDAKGYPQTTGPEAVRGSVTTV
jgi:hypothetical protein